MSRTRIFLTALFLMSGATFVDAQETRCTLKIEQSPEVRGFRLGMAIEQVKARVPSFNVASDGKFGLSAGGLDGSTLRQISGAAYNNVNKVYFNFFDGRATYITVLYQGVNWRNGDEFMAKVNEAFNLPNAWELQDRNRRILRCDGWSMEAYASQSDASLILKGPSVDQTVRRRQEEYEEQQRKSFKP